MLNIPLYSIVLTLSAVCWVAYSGFLEHFLLPFVAGNEGHERGDRTKTIKLLGTKTNSCKMLKRSVELTRSIKLWDKSVCLSVHAVIRSIIETC